MAGIPEYIIAAARAYRQEHGGGQRTEDAFIAGYKAAKAKPKVVERELTAEELQLFEDCWKAYGRKGSKKDSLAVWRTLSQDEMQRVMPHLRHYVTSREAQFTKDFQRYLSHRTFNDLVMGAGGTVLYDPKTVEADGYHPTVDGIFQYWDERNKRLIFNGDIEHLDDGYSADTRPDGACAAWNMYEWTWSRAQRMWVKKCH